MSMKISHLWVKQVVVGHEDDISVLFEWAWQVIWTNSMETNSQINDTIYSRKENIAASPDWRIVLNATISFIDSIMAIKQHAGSHLCFLPVFTRSSTSRIEFTISLSVLFSKIEQQEKILWKQSYLWVDSCINS